MTLDIQEEEEITLRQTSYLLQIHARLPGKGPTMTAGYLRLQLTDLSTQHVYTGEYSSDYVEEIAMKTGNFKRFVVFVEMVVSAMKQVGCCSSSHVVNMILCFSHEYVMTIGFYSINS